MKFAHLADIHLGGWKDPKLTQLGEQAFAKAIETCLEQKVDFIIIAGDLFNTAIPSIDIIKECTRILRKIHDANIPVYAIPGSHDFSSAGKTMLDVLEKAGLLTNVMKHKNEKQLDFTIDEKTGTKLAGFYGKKGGLEKFEMNELDKTNLENETGFKIFLFHTGIYEFMPLKLKDKMESAPHNLLPKNFHYYAGGHIHYIHQHKTENSLLTFPGALFPNSFSELEEYHHGGIYIVDEKLNYEWIPINLKEVITLQINAEGKTPTQVTEEILEQGKNSENKILTIRLSGELAQGKPSDINFNDITELLPNTYSILRNTSQLSSKEHQEIIITQKTVEELEEDIIASAESSSLSEEHLAKTLMQALNTEKQDGEKNAIFEERIISELNSLFKYP